MTAPVSNDLHECMVAAVLSGGCIERIGTARQKRHTAEDFHYTSP
jgi:hypothetical protein